MGMDEGFKATEDFVAAAGRVRGLMADGRVARAEVEQVRTAAARAYTEAQRALGRAVPQSNPVIEATAADTEAERIWRAHTQVAIGHLRGQLKMQRDRLVSLGVTTQDAAQRFAEQAIAQAQLDATVSLASLLLGKEDFTLLMDTLGLTAHHSAR